MLCKPHSITHKLYKKKPYCSTRLIANKPPEKATHNCVTTTTTNAQWKWLPSQCRDLHSHFCWLPRYAQGTRAPAAAHSARQLAAGSWPQCSGQCSISLSLSSAYNILNLQIVVAY